MILRKFFEFLRNYFRTFPIRSIAVSSFISVLVWETLVNALASTISEFYTKTIHPWFLQPVAVNIYVVLGYSLVLSLLVFFLYQLFFRPPSLSTLPITQLDKLNEPLMNAKTGLFFELSIDIDKLTTDFILSTDKEQGLEIFVHSFFNTLAKRYGVDQIHGGGILLPEKDDPNVLAFWKMSPDEPLSPKRFLINDIASPQQGDLKQGTAGYVYKTGQSKIEIIENVLTGDAKDRKHFHNFRMNRAATPYRSFVVLPIHTGNSNKRVTGLLSIQGHNEDTFSARDLYLLEQIADKLSPVLLLGGMIR